MKNIIKNLQPLICLLGLALGMPLLGWGQTPAPTVSLKSSTTPTLLEEKQRLELERLQLENDKLKLEMEKQKFEMEKAKRQNTGLSNEDKIKIIENEKLEISKKAENLAGANKDKENILILDFVNSEIWNDGIRYSIHELQDLAEDHHWNVIRRIDQKSSSGDPRYLSRIKNISLLKYAGQKRGILTVRPPVKNEDFQMLTPEGATLQSSIGEIRNSYNNKYFSYDGEENGTTLRF